MKKNIIAATVAALLLPSAAFAADGFFAADSTMDYTFGELAFNDLDEVDGLSIEGSFEFTDLLFGFASYDNLGADGFDSTSLAFGAGIAIGLNETVDAYGKFGLVMNDIEVGTFEDDDTGFGLEIGLRAMVAEQVEVFGGVEMVDIYEDSQTGLEIGGRYWVQENFGVSLSFRDVEENSGFSLAARYNF